MANICIVNHDVKTIVRGKRNIYTWLRAVAAKESKHIDSLTIILCSDEFLLDMNRNHLNHDYYTDVITFDLSDNPSFINGEIYISIDRVNENALSLKQSPTDELHRVMIHGLLHLLGYKDKTTQQQKLMRKKEDEYLNERKAI
jgi:rRNA maturation RNase YbeY